MELYSEIASAQAAREQAIQTKIANREKAQRRREYEKLKQEFEQ